MTFDWLWVGLGNPGEDYERSRHNVGFMIMDALADRHKARVTRREHESLTGRMTVGGKKIMLCKPQTFMNDSGRALASLVRFYKIPSRQILLVYDDMDFDLGVIKLRAQGSAGTHNGVQSIIDALGTPDFPRLRIGIGPRPLSPQSKDYVLGKFSAQDLPLLKDILSRSVAALERVLDAGLEKAMNGVNAV
jgi:PTH1 family peptidyl-tRNA hydrolase